MCFDNNIIYGGDLASTINVSTTVRSKVVVAEAVVVSVCVDLPLCDVAFLVHTHLTFMGKEKPPGAPILNEYLFLS